jgi:signal transduction histidine kinase
MVRAVNAALDRVEEAFRQQRRFTADAAHEMRTPIAVLRAHLDTLEDAHASELAQDLQALDRVVAQLLKLAQADSLSVEPRGRADLHRVAVNVAALMGPGAIRAGRDIAVSGDEACVVAGDGDALEVAVRNLVENALNHTPEGSEVEIRVDAAARALAVLDRGPGVPEADRERVFQRFWRGERRSAPGAGLGLSIVARIALAHGAVTRIEDRDGGGAAFVLSFPAPADD